METIGNKSIKRGKGMNEKALELINRANGHAMNQEYDQALACFDEAVAHDDGGYQALLHKANFLLQLDRHDESFALVDDAIRDHAGTELEAEILHIKAYLHGKQGQRLRTVVHIASMQGVKGISAEQKAQAERDAVPHLEKALATYDRVLTLANDHVGALIGRAETLRGLDRHGEALPAIEQALSRIQADDDETRRRLVFQKGGVLRGLGRTEDAVDAYRSVIDMVGEEQSAPYWMEIANIRIDEERFDAALEAIERAETPQAAVGYWSIKGKVLLALKRFEDAAETYRRAVEDDRFDFNARVLRGVALSRMGRYDDALACYDDALTSVQNFPDALLQKGITLREMGKPRRALSLFEKLVKQGRPRGTNYFVKLAWYEKGKTLHGMNKNRRAVQCFDKALEIDPSYEAAHNEKRRVLSGL